jgi:hypothetical protein
MDGSQVGLHTVLYHKILSLIHSKPSDSPIFIAIVTSDPAKKFSRSCDSLY